MGHQNPKTCSACFVKPCELTLLRRCSVSQNLRNMVSPEERMGVDNVLSVMATVADVEVSNDLQVVKVFVSILGDERGKKNAINGLKKMEGYVRKRIGAKVSLRLTPEIRFVYDDSFERGQRVTSLLDTLRTERAPGVDGKINLRSASELQAVEDSISNPYDDDEDDDEDETNERRNVRSVNVPTLDDLLAGNYDDDEEEEEEEEEGAEEVINV